MASCCKACPRNGDGRTILILLLLLLLLRQQRRARRCKKEELREEVAQERRQASHQKKRLVATMCKRALCVECCSIWMACCATASIALGKLGSLCLQRWASLWQLKISSPSWALVGLLFSSYTVAKSPLCCSNCAISLSPCSGFLIANGHSTAEKTEQEKKKTKQNKTDLQSDDYYWKSSTTCSSSDAIVVLESSSLSSLCIVHQVRRIFWAELQRNMESRTLILSLQNSASSRSTLIR